jgi:ATP-dependent DNA helicase 2 subunit 2
MSEVQFLWADTASGKAQVEFSSIVQAMHHKNLVAVSRWVTRDHGDPKMGILIPRLWENIDSLSWVQVCLSCRINLSCKTVSNTGTFRG